MTSVTTRPVADSAAPPAAYWLRGVLRIQKLVLLGLITGLFLAVFAWTSVSDWGGSVYMLLDTAASATPFMVAWLAGVGVTVGQWRWRSGSAQWDYFSPRGKAVPIALGAVGGGLLPLVGMTVYLAVTVPLALYGSLHDGLDSASIMADVCDSIPLIFALTARFCAVSCVAALVGGCVRYKFLAALAAVVVFVATIIVAFNVELMGEHERLDSASIADVECTATAPTVCGLPTNQAYFAAAQESLTHYMESSPYSDILPDKVLVTDSSFRDIPEQLRNDFPIALQLMRQRAITAPHRLADEKTVSQNISLSLAHACAAPLSDESTRVQEILNGTPRNPGEKEANSTELGDLLSCLNHH